MKQRQTQILSEFDLRWTYHTPTFHNYVFHSHRCIDDISRQICLICVELLSVFRWLSTKLLQVPVWNQSISSYIFYFIAINHRTDSLIQQTIRKKFADCTVLTVAHRLHTIIDSDRILVMKTGRIIEFDAPNELLKNECGAFTKMVNALGYTYSEQLYSTASCQHRHIISQWL